MHFHLLIALTIIVNVCCLPLEKTNRPSANIDPTLPIQCRDINGQNASKVAIEREDCRRIYENEYIRWSESMLANIEFAKNVEVINSSEGLLSRTKRGVKRCPVFTDAYLSSGVEDHRRSTSPWKFVVDLDTNRVPEKLLDSRCLCSGCIDMRTRLEDRVNMFSKPIHVTVPVKKSGELTTVDVTIGCTCVIPVNEST